MSKLRLWDIFVGCFYWVVVEDGKDPFETLNEYHPYGIDCTEMPGYWDREWPDGMSNEDVVEALKGNVEVTEVTDGETLDLCWTAVENLGFDDLLDEWGNVEPVPIERLLDTSDHGDMWSEAWDEW